MNNTHSAFSTMSGRSGGTPRGCCTYLGSVVGDRMTLRAVAGTDTLGPFALQRDATPQLYKCL